MSYDSLGLAPVGADDTQLLQLVGHLGRLKSVHADRDRRMKDVLAVRDGRMNEVYPSLFPEGPYDKGIVSNMIDVAARDLAETLAPLPTFTCQSAKSVSDAAKKFAEKRGKIASYYVEFSNLQDQMFDAADRYYTYGFVPGMVEIDTEAQMPRIVFHDSQGAYPIFNRWHECCGIFFEFYRTRDELCAEYPECDGRLPRTSGEANVRVVRYHDKDWDALFLPDAAPKGMVLERSKNHVGECLVEIVQRPGLNTTVHGQFDDVLAVQVAKARFALLGLDAATQAVMAPLVVPDDVNEVTFGPNATIRTRTPAGVGRVKLDVPPDAYRQQGVLDQELRQGSRYPNARNGEIDGSVVTGKGVEALMSGFDTQLRTGQSRFARGLSRLITKAFRADEKIFGNLKRTVRGNTQGAPYEIDYTPSRDIKGDYTVEVQYGLMAGLAPNQMLIFGLQAQGAKLFSRELLMGHMPVNINPTEEIQRIDIESMRDALLEAMAGYSQAIPALAQSGQDPASVLSKMATIIQARQSGKAIEDAIAEAFAPPPVPPGVETADEAATAPGQPPPGGPLPPGMGPDGLLQGVATGQAGMPAGGQPDIMTAIAGLTATGKPNLSGSISRRTPIR